jgi:hypothetical protein
MRIALRSRSSSRVLTLGVLQLHWGQQRVWLAVGHLPAKQLRPMPAWQMHTWAATQMPRRQQLQQQQAQAAPDLQLSSSSNSSLQGVEGWPVMPP